MLVAKALPDDVNEIAIVRKGRNTLATLAGKSKPFISPIIDAFDAQMAKKNIQRPTIFVGTIGERDLSTKTNSHRYILINYSLFIDINIHCHCQILSATYLTFVGTWVGGMNLIHISPLIIQSIK